MQHLVLRLFGALVAASLLAAATFTPVNAQAQYTETKLKAFVVAAVEVNRLIEEWGPKIKGAADEAQADELARQANADLKNAIVKTEGITLDEYNQIARSAREDKTLANRIRDVHDKMQKKE